MVKTDMSTGIDKIEKARTGEKKTNSEFQTSSHPIKESSSDSNEKRFYLLCTYYKSMNVRGKTTTITFLLPFQ